MRPGLFEQDASGTHVSMLAPRDSARAASGAGSRDRPAEATAEEASTAPAAVQQMGRGVVRGGRFTGERAPTASAASAGRSPTPAASGSGRTKLVLHYTEGENPMHDFLRLGGGQGMDVIVEAISEHGKAARAGVKPGFALVTLNGRSEFAQLPGWQVRLLLDSPPITLGFDPSPVKPQSMKCTEIRLTRPEEVLGIPPRVAVCDPRDQNFLTEEVVFKPSAAPLWLSAWGDESVPEVTVSNPQSRRVYELRRPEASALVGHAIRGARAMSPDIAERDDRWIADAAHRARASRWRVPLCSMDCVSDCVAEGGDVVVNPRVAPVLSRTDKGADASAAGAASGNVFASVVASVGEAEQHGVMRWSQAASARGPGVAEPRGLRPRGAVFGPWVGSPRGAKVEAPGDVGAFAFGLGRRAPGVGSSMSWAAVSAPGPGAEGGDGQGFFAGDDGVGCELDLTAASHAGLASTPRGATTPPLMHVGVFPKGLEVRLTDIYSTEVGTCQI